MIFDHPKMTIDTLNEQPIFILLLSVLTLSIIITIVWTVIWSTLRFFIDIRQYKSTSQKPVQPPRVPYAIPILRHSLYFLNRNPAAFWKKLVQLYTNGPRIYTYFLGSQKCYIVGSPQVVDHVLKNRTLNREIFNIQAVRQGFGVSDTDSQKLYGSEENENLKRPDGSNRDIAQEQEHTYVEYLLKKDRVNELTATFIRSFQSILAESLQDGGAEEVHLFKWMRYTIFTASTNALYGERLLQIYPELIKDFFVYDFYLMDLLLGVPKWFTPNAYRAREKILAGFERWGAEALMECKGKSADPEGPVTCDPMFGSRFVRARQQLYESLGLSDRSTAGMHLGFLLGLNGNSITTAGWMMLHILNPHDGEALLRRVFNEVQSAQRKDGSLDVSILTSLPLLQSIYFEVLRLYTDALVARQLSSDLSVPIDNQGKQVLLKKDAILMMPNWVLHHDKENWAEPPPDRFYAERYLTIDPVTGKETFSTLGTAGRLFPFGGGKQICPGRVFAKQEILASVASILLCLDIEVVGFIDKKERGTNMFPGLRSEYPGKGVMVMGGDMKVRIKKRRQDTGKSLEVIG